MNLKIKNLILFLSPLVYLLANAQSDLTRSTVRPKISEVLEFHPGYKAEKGIPTTGNRLAFEDFKDSIAEGAPQFIVQLEKAYPGATFAFMGRDTQAISDIVDAFYQSIGQKNRVVQVAMSKPTLAGLSNEDIEKYLKYFGLDLDALSTEKPFILVDTVSSGDVIDGVRISGRQGRNLLQVIYSAWVKRGRDPKELLDKVNMVAMQVSTFKKADPDNIKRYTEISKLSSVKKANETMFPGKIVNLDRIGADMVLPIIADTNNLFNEAGYDHFTGAWHQKFQRPVMSGGMLKPNPGEKTDLIQRKSILWLQHQIIEIVSDPEFRRNVMTEADRFEVKFHDLKLDQTLISCQNVYK